MPDDALATTIRRLVAAENRIRDLAAVETPVTFGDLVGTVSGFEGLRGFWPFSVTDENGFVSDESGQIRTLVNNNAASFSVLNNFIRYAVLNGTNQSFSRLTEPGLEISSTLTIGGWFYADGVSSRQALISKFNTTGNKRSYLLEITAAGVLQAILSANGTAESSYAHGTTLTAAKWFFAALSFTPSSDVTIYLNNVLTSSAASVPASLAVTDAAFGVGGRADNVNYLAGRAAMVFAAASAVPESLLKRFYNLSRIFFGV